MEGELSSEFVVPCEDDFLGFAGVAAEAIPGSDLAWKVVFTVNMRRLTLSYDKPLGLIKVQLEFDGDLVLDLERDSAVLMTLESSGGRSWVSVMFDARTIRGVMEIQIFPTIQVIDNTLRVSE
jgi:hypothetical protein